MSQIKVEHVYVIIVSVKKRTYKNHKEWATDMSYENNGGLVIDDTGECESCQ